MPAAGLEPARSCPQQILSLPRLPFRHAGVAYCENYITIFENNCQVISYFFYCFMYLFVTIHSLANHSLISQA